jgi:hypothetical protein
MNNIIWLVDAIVLIAIVLSVLGLRQSVYVSA